jgi:fructokinase
MTDITAVGEILIDLTQSGFNDLGIPLFAANPGGALISYDPNYRASLWKDEAIAVEWMRFPLDMVDVLKVSDEELPLLTGTADLEAGSQILADFGIGLVLVTLGAEGAYYRFGSHTGHVPGVKVQVGDTNGAGDTFFGAALAQLCRFRKLRDITVPELNTIIAVANKAAAITTSRHGAIPAMPTYQEVFGE